MANEPEDSIKNIVKEYLISTRVEGRIFDLELSSKINLTNEEKQLLKDEIISIVNLNVSQESIFKLVNPILHRSLEQVRYDNNTLVDRLDKLEARPSIDINNKLEIHHYRRNNTNEVEVDIQHLQGQQHKEFPTMLEFMKLGMNIYVFGPTGTGKTKTALLIANDVLKIPVHSVTLGPQTPSSKIKGYMDASGKYVAGAAYEMYKNGGLFIINEIDNGNAAINVELNELCDDECYFPCGKTKRHEKFFMIATANTIGNGANRSYIGRSPQDKSLLNRFVFLEWNYDYELERQLGWKAYQYYGGISEELYTKALHDFWKIRRASENLKLDVIYSSRNLIDQLARMSAAKLPIVTIAKSIFCRGMEVDQYRKLINESNSINIKDIIKNEKECVISNTSLIEAPRTSIDDINYNPINSKLTVYTNAAGRK